MTGITSPRTARRDAIRDFKRQAILRAALSVFSETGLDGATVRAIADRAGYAPGAIYLYYESKEAIYAEILGDSLTRLNDAVKAAANRTGPAKAQSAFLAFFDYYAAHPAELELGLYLFKGARRRGLSPELDRRLNGKLIATMQLMATALATQAGLDPETANFRTVSLTSHMVGCLILEGTGRLKVMGQEARALVKERVEEVLERVSGPRPV